MRGNIIKEVKLVPSVAGRIIFSMVSVGFKADLSNDSRPWSKFCCVFSSWTATTTHTKKIRMIISNAKQATWNSNRFGGCCVRNSFRNVYKAIREPINRIRRVEMAYVRDNIASLLYVPSASGRTTFSWVSACFSTEGSKSSTPFNTACWAFSVANSTVKIKKKS